MVRILRDAQVNTVCEGPDNVLCLDVRRAMDREQAHKPFLHRLRDPVDAAPAEAAAAATVVAQRVDELETAVEQWNLLDTFTAEVRLFPLAQLMVDVYAAALLLEQAGWESRELGGGRKALVARLYVRRHLEDVSRLEQVTVQKDEALAHVDLLLDRVHRPE